jgi:uncharacterized membrane protein YcaP (DUF421 family)
VCLPLAGHLRKAGVDEIERVKAAYIESDGEISIVTYGTVDPNERRESTIRADVRSSGA